MKQRIIGKGLAVAVILLFLGVGIQPAIATTPNVIDNIKNLKDYNYKEYIPVIRVIRCIILYIGMGIVYSIMEKLEGYDDNPAINIFIIVLILLYAFMGVRFFYLSGWTP